MYHGTIISVEDHTTVIVQLSKHAPKVRLEGHFLTVKSTFLTDVYDLNGNTIGCYAPTIGHLKVVEVYPNFCVCHYDHTGVAGMRGFHQLAPGQLIYVGYDMYTAPDSDEALINGGDASEANESYLVHIDTEDREWVENAVRDIFDPKKLQMQGSASIASTEEKEEQQHPLGWLPGDH
jgi:hypothetical protein